MIRPAMFCRCCSMVMPDGLELSLSRRPAKPYGCCTTVRPAGLKLSLSRRPARLCPDWALSPVSCFFTPMDWCIQKASCLQGP